MTLLNIAPDGRNINDNCGALHPDYVAARSGRARRADLGSPLTAMPTAACWPDANNNVINGDAILLMTARDLKRADC